MKELLKKTYQVELFWQELNFKQLSFLECIEYHNLFLSKDFNMYVFIYDFLKDKISLQIEDVFKIDTKIFIQMFKDYAMKWFYSDSKNLVEKECNTPLSSEFDFIQKEFWWDLISIFEKYTPEAIYYILEWTIYNKNEQTKEWKKLNMIKLAKEKIKSWDNDSDLEFIKKQKEKYLNNKLKKNG